MRIVTAVRARDKQDHEAARIRNYELSNLFIFAQHDPKKMPKYQAVSAKSELVSDEAQQARARGAFIALALRSKG
ncbi:hypothetical protein SAMN04488005_1506 [Yoonia tamlensis]|uniref:Uncharacterized protein n=1 Tax=Yoonia tamlensis TaxID=390270 RepID=A0A1I6GEE9_9RHOB|nr:hypothetical protein SAMN04488005_1506 [Yoonia tamlensis]